MLKRVLSFTGFLFLCIIVGVQGRELFLSFFVFFPMLLFPLFYFLEDETKKLAYLSLCSALGLFLYFLILKPMVETVILGILFTAVFLFFIFYRSFWRRIVRAETLQLQETRQGLENLRSKHQSRLESLHHLEKQVAGLLDLFEISKDFNDTLSFEGIGAILHERVLPELPFSEMLLILLDRKESEASIARILSITERGVQDRLNSEILKPLQWKMIERVIETKILAQEDQSVTFPILVDGAINAYLVVDHFQSDDLAKFEVLSAYLALQVKKVKLYETVKELSIQDGLTGVFIRRHFMERFDEELRRSIKFDLPLAVLMLDIDQFKRYNDNYGHLAGDATLKQVAFLLRQSLRRVDIIARYGGEEFIVITPETKKDAVAEVAERIRSNIARHNFKVFSDQTRVTVSIGISIFPGDSTDIDAKNDTATLANELIQRADKALYRAKEEGRNRIIFYQDL